MHIHTTRYQDLIILAHTGRSGFLTYTVQVRGTSPAPDTHYARFADAYRELTEREYYAKKG